MKKTLLILSVVLIYCGTTTIAQDQLTAGDSSRIKNLRYDIYSIQTVVTCHGQFEDLNEQIETTIFSFPLFSTACKIKSYILAANHAVDYRAILYKLFDFLASARATGDYDYGVLAHSMHKIEIQHTILSYWGAHYSMTETLLCNWQGSLVTEERFEKFMASIVVNQDKPLTKSFTIIAVSDSLDLALIETYPRQMAGQLTFGRTEEVNKDEILIGLNAQPNSVSRSFNYIYNTGHITHKEFEYSDPRYTLPYSAMVLTMETKPGNSGDPIISISDNKLMGITVRRMSPWNLTDGMSNWRVIVPADLIEKFYHKTMKTFYGE